MPDASERVYQPPGPVARAFLKSRAFVRGIRGPFGSGKSVACCMAILSETHQRIPAKGGKRRARWAVVRGTYPELKTTTIKTWHEWVPQGLGRWQGEGPPTHRIETDEIDLEVMFVALDKPDDVRKLLSMELTGAWINEAREAPKAILDGLTGRVGRFPPASDGSTGWHGIIMDTNPPDSDHWWYRLAEEETPAEWAFFSQPSGLDAAAENRQHLVPTYYERLSAGKDEDWIKVYIRGEYGFVRDGKPIYPEWRDGLHAAEVATMPTLGLWIGIDWGLTPAAAIAQRGVMGDWRVIDELVTEDMGARRFGELLKAKIEREYPKFRIEGIFGDPAGMGRAQTDEDTPFRVVKAIGLDALPAPSNDFTLRREAVALPLTRLVDGRPGLVVHPRCRVLRKAMGGAYCYRRLLVSGEERYRDAPDKNQFSHVAEALQYLMLGAGEGRTVLRRTESMGGGRGRLARGVDFSLT